MALCYRHYCVSEKNCTELIRLDGVSTGQNRGFEPNLKIFCRGLFEIGDRLLWVY